jgi:hypothetical protein
MIDEVFIAGACGFFRFIMKFRTNIKIDEKKDVNRTSEAAIPRNSEPTIPLTFAVWEIINEISPRGPVANPQSGASRKGT